MSDEGHVLGAPYPARTWPTKSVRERQPLQRALDNMDVPDMPLIIIGELQPRPSQRHLDTRFEFSTAQVATLLVRSRL